MELITRAAEDGHLGHMTSPISIAGSTLFEKLESSAISRAVTFSAAQEVTTPLLRSRSPARKGQGNKTGPYTGWIPVSSPTHCVSSSLNTHLGGKELEINLFPAHS